MNELELLHERLRNHESLHETILNFPKKVHYDCMVPLSKVAFAPGKVIHTNEFYKKNRRDKMEIRSYFDVAEELQQSIRSLKKQIELIHPSVPSSPNPYDTFVNQQSNLLKSLSQESFVIPQAVQDTPQQPNPIPLLEEEEAVAEGEDADSRFGAVEIRETYDQDGNVIDSQLVDLTSALKSSKSMLSESKASDESKDNAFADEMYEKLQQRLNLPTGQADDEGLLRDPEGQFIRELAEISLQRSAKSQSRSKSAAAPAAANDDDDIFDTLSRLEMKEKSALDLAHNEPTPSVPKEADLLTSKEWKKGFLGSKSGKKDKSPKLHQQPQSVASLHPTGSDVRTTRGILKTSASGRGPGTGAKEVPPTLSAQAYPPPPPPQNSRSAPSMTMPRRQEEAAMPAPAVTEAPEPKRVSKFKAERMGGVNMIADMNANQRISEGTTTATKPFTGRIVERK